MARPRAGHYYRASQARQYIVVLRTTNVTYLKFFFCIVRSAYALQKTSFFVLFTNKTSFFGGIYGALFFQFFFQKKADAHN